MDLRGSSFKEAFQTLKTMLLPCPTLRSPVYRPLRLAILHAGGFTGMNTAVRAAVRIGLIRGTPCSVCRTVSQD